MAFLLQLQPGVEITLVLCLRFNATLEEIYGCLTSMFFLMGDVNISYRTARYCQHLRGVVTPDAQ